MAFAWLSVGCRRVVDPALPPTAQAFTPPAVYDTWWSDTEQCLGRAASIRAVSWYVVPGITIPPIGHATAEQELNAYWSAASNRIVLTSEAAVNGGVVRHEMLHALSREPGHARALFLDKCSGIVDCSPACVADAGRLPDAGGASLIASDSLDVQVEVRPESPSLRVDEGFFTVRVLVSNPRDEPVLVALRPGASAAFTYQLISANGGVGGSQPLRDSSVVRFRPRESKQQLFDFRVTRDTVPGALAPGIYTVNGGYGAHFSSRIVELRP